MNMCCLFLIARHSDKKKRTNKNKTAMHLDLAAVSCHTKNNLSYVLPVKTWQILLRTSRVLICGYLASLVVLFCVSCAIN